MKKITLFFCYTFLLLFSVCGQIDLISPIEGSWSNKQMLVINNYSDINDSGEYFYSINGADPATFGFAYDGPVILDIEGDVTLKIAHVLPDNSTEQKELNFTVNIDKAYNTNYADFVSQFIDTGMIYYNSGTNFYIPESLLYNFNNSLQSFSEGKPVSIDENNILSRFVPAIIYDPIKDIKYHFVIKILPQPNGIFSRRDVPFTISDWNTINFTDENLLYKIDNGYWELPKESAFIDRTESHMISWQSLIYETGNPIEFFVIPPKPELNIQTSESGALIYSISAPAEDNYSIGVKNMSVDEFSKPLYTTISVDAFDGDVVKGNFDLEIYSNSVYQGSVPVSYNINKAPVPIPVIISSAKDFYSLKQVSIEIIGDETPDSELYVAVSEPIIVTNSEISQEEYSKNIYIDDLYKKIDEKKYQIQLDSVGEGAAYYKIKAYSQNHNKKSLVAEYAVVVDKYNYYFDLKANPETQDGTIKNPFVSFDKFLESANLSRSVCIHVNGDLVIPEGKNILTANCEIKSSPESMIIFEPGSSLIVRNSTLQINNTRIQNSVNENFTNIIPLIKLENSVLQLNDSVISSDFAKNGLVIESSNSVVNISNCIASIKSLAYASFISAVNSKVNLEKSTVNAFADTCVLISDNNCDSNIFQNNLKVSGRTGRIAEFFGSKVNLTNNKASAQFLNKSPISPVYKNKTAILNEKNNEYIGF